MERDSHFDKTLVNERPQAEERFEVIRAIGQGAGGIVQLVRDRARGGPPVALKTLKNLSAFDEHTLARFQSEMKICMKLRHPNLVEAYDIVETGKGLGFTMEFIDGSDLAKIASRKTLTLREICGFMTQLLAGLEELHRHNLVHRDVKLENLLVRNDDGRLKLSDLGLVKNLNQDKMTRTGILLGTAQYLPPEYVRASVFDRRGDVYAAGLVLLELITGKRWLHDKEGNSALNYLIKSKFKIPSSLLEGIAPPIRTVLLRATHLDVNSRFQTAADMNRALSVALASVERGAPAPAPAATPVPVKRVSSRESRFPVSTTSLAAVSLSLVLGGIVALMALPRPKGALPNALALGVYEGELSGAEKWEGQAFQLEAKDEGITLTTGLTLCPRANVGRTGALICERNGLNLRIISIQPGRILGLIEDSSAKRQFPFQASLRRRSTSR